MKRSRLTLLAALLAAATAFPAFAAHFDIDPVHSTVIYRIKHFTSSNSYGRFDKPAGTFEYDAAAPEKSSFDLTLNVDDINSGDPARDKHLKSPDFFNQKQFPTITFKSSAVKKIADDKLEVTGDVTLHGITKTLTINVDVVGTAKGMAGETRTGFEATFDLKRSDYGMTSFPQVVGDDVRLIVSLEGIQK